MGPSGSGKTSLLSILSGTREHTKGDIYYQGQKKTITKRSEDIMGFHGNASYVTQDDILQGSLTVEETLVEWIIFFYICVVTYLLICVYLK